MALSGFGSEDNVKAVLQTSPAGRPAQPEEIVGPVLFLLSEAAKLRERAQPVGGWRLHAALHQQARKRAGSNMARMTVLPAHISPYSLASSDMPVVLVLASGRGARFAASGGTVHKLQALLAGKPVLARTLDSVRVSALPSHLEDAGHPGMGESIATAVGRTADAKGWLILPGDLPLVQPSTLRTVAAALAQGGCTVVVPTYQGERGHPVGFGTACRAALLGLSGDQGAASVVREQAALGRVQLLEVDDPGTVADVDTLDDLARAEQLLAARRPAR